MPSCSAIRSERHAVRSNALVILEPAGSSAAVFVRNISSSGALLSCGGGLRTRFPVGAAVTIDVVFPPSEEGLTIGLLPARVVRHDDEGLALTWSGSQASMDRVDRYLAGSSRFL
jgi:hypothetical protein